ncbi:autophagy-related protein 13 homolog isoform X3 [Cherax quadricarinatus]|uniref:autophagy-related protein 13 homolog isoform X3 n=1 Tax=Cherax quadricarinatus TaxID=27406 RepID=UPI0023796976|nr:autophagy-related protein 13-like isoform X3 [Cherax quadricarinatus]
MIFCGCKPENKHLGSPSGYEAQHLGASMSGRHLSSEDRRELARLTKILTQKIVQVVVQSRLGEKAFTKSKTPAQGSEWFNLGIEDIHEIQQETKRGLGGHLPDVGKPLVVEILLRTPESDSLVLEFWTLTILDACDSSPSRINPTIYNRMTVLLKSLLAVTRITPAYKLAFRQGPDSFIICYRVYLGDPNYECLGENPIQARLGQVTTPESTLLLCVSYRTQITIAPPSRSPAHDAIMLKSDHFKPEVSPRHCRRVADSDSSCRGYAQQQQQQQPERKVSVAFVDAKPPKPDDFILPDIPFSNLLTSTVEVQLEKKVEKCEGAAHQPSHTTQDHNAQFQERGGAVSGATGGIPQHEAAEKTLMTTSDGSHKSTTSAHLKEEADFVMVELKTPFAGTYDTGNDLGAFYRECQSAPPLRMFADTPEDEISDLTEQLLTFEANMDEYNELVKSLHSENSPNNSD